MMMSVDPMLFAVVNKNNPKTSDSLCSFPIFVMPGVRVWLGTGQGTNPDLAFCCMQEHALVAAAESQEHMCCSLFSEYYLCLHMGLQLTCMSVYWHMHELMHV